MSYDTYRSQIEAKLQTFLPDHLVKAVLGNIDEVSVDYSIQPNIVALSVIDDIPEAMRFYLASKGTKRLAKGTLNNYYRALKNFFQIVRKPVSLIDSKDIHRYIFKYCNERHVQNSTINGILNILSDFFEWCIDEGYIQKNPTRRIERAKTSNRPLPALSSLELERIRFVCKTLREKALIDFMYSTACRVSEVCDMKISDIDWVTKSAVVQHGKGDNRRTVYLNAEAEISLKAYLKSRNDDCEYVFTNERGKDKKHICTRSVQRLIKNLVGKTDITTKVTPHTFRRTSATIASKNGMPVVLIQKMLGHAKIDTTMRYTSIDDADVRYSHERCVI